MSFAETITDQDGIPVLIWNEETRTFTVSDRALLSFLSSIVGKDPNGATVFEAEALDPTENHLRLYDPGVGSVAFQVTSDENGVIQQLLVSGLPVFEVGKQAAVLGGNLAIYAPDLPTSNPNIAGYVYVSSGALKVSAGDGVNQVETATVAETVEGTLGAGNASVIVTASGMAGSPKTISVALAENDSSVAAAGKIRTALGLDAAVTAMFAVSGTGADIVLTALAPAANDATLNIAIADDTCTGLAAAPTSADTTAGHAAT